MKFTQFFYESSDEVQSRVITDFLKSLTNEEKNGLKPQNSGGWCWYMAKKFSEYLNTKGIKNTILEYRSKSDGNHFVNRVNEELIDFTYSQIDKTSPVPKITNIENERVVYGRYIDSPKIYNSFNEVLKQWNMTYSEFIEHLIKDRNGANPAALYVKKS